MEKLKNQSLENLSFLKMNVIDIRSESQVEATTQLAIQTLKKIQREGPIKLEKYPKLIELKTFLKKSSERFPNLSSIKQCTLELSSLRIGIESKVLDANPGFEEFVKKNSLERYLKKFHHKLAIHSNNEIFILKNNKLVSWKSISEYANQDHPTHPVSTLYNPAWKYGEFGLQNKNFYQWKKLKPFKHVQNPKWGDRFILEFCMQCSGKLRLRGDHTWIRLKTPRGEVFSVGVYREDNEVKTGFSVKKGFLQSPDVSEFWQEKIYKIPFEISKESFEKIKKRIELDKQENKTLFHIGTQNCTSYAMDLAKIAKLNIPSRFSGMQMFVPQLIRHPIYLIFSKLPFFLQNIARRIWNIVRWPICVTLNLFFNSFGGSLVSKLAKKMGAKSHYNSIFDYFKSSKIDIDSPFVLTFETLKRVEKLRQIEKQRLEKNGASLSQIEKVRFWTPPNFSKF